MWFMMLFGVVVCQADLRGTSAQPDSPSVLGGAINLCAHRTVVGVAGV
jgi:hypothetical protein